MWIKLDENGYNTGNMSNMKNEGFTEVEVLPPDIFECAYKYNPDDKENLWIFDEDKKKELDTLKAKEAEEYQKKLEEEKSKPTEMEEVYMTISDVLCEIDMIKMRLEEE